MDVVVFTKVSPGNEPVPDTVKPVIALTGDETAVQWIVAPAALELNAIPLRNDPEHTSSVQLLISDTLGTEFTSTKWLAGV